MRMFKRITALALAAVTAGAMGLGAAAEVDKLVDEEYIGGYTIEERAAWGIDDYAENIKTAFKLTYPDEEDVIDDIVDAITESDVFSELFEEDARAAFQIVEDSLRDALEPSAMPIDQDDERDFSQYDVLLIKQTAADEISSAAAAATMALMGCGASGYSQNSANNVKSQLNSDGSTNITIHKITNLLKKNKKDVSGFSYRTMAFTPRNTTYSRASNLIDCLSYALVYDTVPVIRVDKASLLNYYNNDIAYPIYLAVIEVDHTAESITVYDPNSTGSHILDYYEVEDLLVGSKVLWVSAFANDKRLLGLANVMAEYPDGSYYNTRTDGKACDYHEPGETGDFCIKEANGWWQCAGFASRVYQSIHGILPKYGMETYFGSTNSSSSTAAQNILKSLPIGTYVRTYTKYVNANGVRGQHSFALLGASSSSITIYHANWDCQCKVLLETMSWTDFAKNFPWLYFYID